jgi:hypothetical protein
LFETEVLWGPENKVESQLREPGDTCHSIYVEDSHKRPQCDDLQFHQFSSKCIIAFFLIAE